MRMKLFEQFALGELDKIGRPLTDEMYRKRPAWAVGSVSDYDAAFFSGLAMVVKPKKIVEVGVASGWGSVMLLKSLQEAGVTDYEYFGVDISHRFYHDNSYATGQVMNEVTPELALRYRLLTGRSIAEVAPEIGEGIDFAFIDAHHMHPWATLDLLALLPFLVPESWVTMHDLNLCLKENHKHKNRGPKYLFESWDGDKVHSIQVPTMAGALRLGADPKEHLPLLLDVLYTPWELPVDGRHLTAITNILTKAYGVQWGEKFQEAFDAGNHFVKKMHSNTTQSATAVTLGERVVAKARHVAGRLSRRLGL